MASYLTSWLAPKPASVTTSIPGAFPLDDDDAPPAFPALNSIQRSGSSSTDDESDALDEATPKMGVVSLPTPTLVLSTDQAERPPSPDSLLMPPPPSLPLSRSSPAASLPSTAASSSKPPSSSGSSLQPPPSTSTPMPNTNRKAKARAKVALAPGHSALDWARLKSSGEDLRCGITTLMRITPSELAEHNTRDSAWSAFSGKVYNITPYLPYHPGGEKELMRVAGRDGTRLFALTHSWVNLDFMLDGCLLGFLVPE